LAVALKLLSGSGSVSVNSAMWGVYGDPVVALKWTGSGSMAPGEIESQEPPNPSAPALAGIHPAATAMAVSAHAWIPIRIAGTVAK
jgi:hypothetical protein